MSLVDSRRERVLERISEGISERVFQKNKKLIRVDCKVVNRSGSLLLYYRKFNYDDTFRLQTVADSLDSNCLILKSNEVYHFVYRLAGVWQASYQYEEALLLRLADRIPHYVLHRSAVRIGSTRRKSKTEELIKLSISSDQLYGRFHTCDSMVNRFRILVENR